MESERIVGRNERVTDKLVEEEQSSDIKVRQTQRDGQSLAKRG